LDGHDQIIRRSEGSCSWCEWPSLKVISFRRESPEARARRLKEKSPEAKRDSPEAKDYMITKDDLVVGDSLAAKREALRPKVI